MKTSKGVKRSGLGLLIVCAVSFGFSSAQERGGNLAYEPTAEYPFGRRNPAAPAELEQFHFMIGKNDCSDERLNNATQEWETGSRTWDAHYYMNGHAIRDSGRSGVTTNGNIRIYDIASGNWKVTFFSMPAYSSGVWSGGKVGDEIVLKQPQKAPGTDFDGFSTLSFYNISDEGFDWRGEWISADGSVVFPFWRISCTKRE